MDVAMVMPGRFAMLVSRKTTKNNSDSMLLSNRFKTGPVRQMLASAALLFGSTSVAAPEGDINLDGVGQFLAPSYVDQN